VEAVADEGIGAEWADEALGAYDACARVVAGGDRRVPVGVEDRVGPVARARQAGLVDARRSDVDPAASRHGLQALAQGVGEHRHRDVPPGCGVVGADRHDDEVVLLDGRPGRLREEVERRGAALRRVADIRAQRREVSPDPREVAVPQEHDAHHVTTPR
jgi:hypothetical protein